MRIDHDTVAQAILSAPAWARVGITAPDERMREDAAQELASVILSDKPRDTGGDDQLAPAL
ncbi:DUF6771 family protein [Novosphingobium olei]|uniref:DUF6771 family protein n=1 Tax=Novosphingobium olei TaxID=2728851 RepID=UPI001F0D0832|nr:DUF6771 family protein [Novosphingobium olei]